MHAKASFTGSSIHPPVKKARDFADFCFPRAGGNEGMAQALCPRGHLWLG